MCVCGLRFVYLWVCVFVGNVEGGERLSRDYSVWVVLTTLLTQSASKALSNPASAQSALKSSVHSKVSSIKTRCLARSGKECLTRVLCMASNHLKQGFVRSRVSHYQTSDLQSV